MSNNGFHTNELKTNPAPQPQERKEKPPFFRPEAVGATQQKPYGEILLLRPLPLIFLGVFAICSAAAILGFLLFGHYTERASVSGVFLMETASTPYTSAAQAELYLPGRLLRYVHSGDRLQLHCPVLGDCAWDGKDAIVRHVSNASLNPAQVFARADLTVQEPMFVVVVAIPRQQVAAAQQVPMAGTKIEAYLRLSQKPLLKWLVDRSQA